MASDTTTSLTQQLDRSKPVAPLAIIAMPSARELGQKISRYITSYREEALKRDSSLSYRDDYLKDDFLMNVNLERFPSGEGRAVLLESARGRDVFILVDVMNWTVTYRMNGFINHMSPDNHFQDLKRVISAIQGKARRVTVIMPFLYEGRQHHKGFGESLDAANMLNELFEMGIDNFITFDAHDPRIASVAPLENFDNFVSPYQFLHALLNTVDDLEVDKDHVVVISPDEGALDRTVYFANVIGADTGMFYKRRDYSRIVNGKNPIVEHQFLGTELRGKDAIIIDDMISSGGSMLDTSRQLKEHMHAGRVFICTTFGLFTDGLDAFDRAYAAGWFDKLVTTNLTYLPEGLTKRPYFAEADMSSFLATIIDYFNHDASISGMKVATQKIHALLAEYNRMEKKALHDEESGMEI
ncbi:MAG: ribose-phosphate pyrophosphokinase [Lachnospiraceae bacterium]|nr:ribose-phosphate pyrophosphokinase [Lachnospiraceae bacterium]